MRSLARMFETWTDAVFGEMNNRAPSSPFVSPSASSATTSRSRGVSSAGPSSASPPPRRRSSAASSSTRVPPQRSKSAAAIAACSLASSSRPSATRVLPAPTWAVPSAAGRTSVPARDRRLVPVERAFGSPDASRSCACGEQPVRLACRARDGPIRSATRRRTLAPPRSARHPSSIARTTSCTS